LLRGETQVVRFVEVSEADFNVDHYYL